MQRTIGLTSAPLGLALASGEKRPLSSWSDSRHWLLTPLLVLLACSPQVETGDPAPGASSGGFDLSQARVVDLSHGYDETTLYWPTSPTRFELTPLAYGPTEGGYFYSANSFCMPEHGGTHMDAPLHFAEGRWTLGEIPPSRLVAPGIVIDVKQATSADPDYRLTPADVEAWEAEHGTIPAGAIVLLRTGWGRRWPAARAYLGDDTPGDASNLHFPAYGEDAARLLVEERKVGALGVDTASIDYGPSQDFIVHQIANGANVPGLENVANLDQLPEVGSWIVALPMKITQGSGGPVRIVALLPPAETRE